MFSWFEKVKNKLPMRHISTRYGFTKSPLYPAYVIILFSKTNLTFLIEKVGQTRCQSPEFMQGNYY